MAKKIDHIIPMSKIKFPVLKYNQKIPIWDGKLTIKEVYEEIMDYMDYLGLDKLTGLVDYFMLDSDVKYGDYLKPDSIWPVNGRTFCYAVTGTSEGHYFHVAYMGEVSKGNHSHLTMLVGKTFMGMEHAMEWVSVLTGILDI